MYPKDYLEIISDICQKNNIHIQSFNDTSILRLSYNSQYHYIWTRRFDLNSSLSSRIADNKYETYIVLNSLDIPVVNCHRMSRVETEEYESSPYSNIDICLSLLKQYKSIVIKPNNSYEGTDVYKCSSIKEIEKVLTEIGEKYKFLVASPYINAANEYRIFYLNNEILLVYEKNLPFIIADGHSTVSEILMKEKHDLTKLDPQLFTKLNEIYPKGQKIFINWKFNLSQGSTCKIVTNQELIFKLSTIAIDAANAIGISFATIDILKDQNGVFKVLEINAGVAMDQFIQQVHHGKKIATAIYEKAILSMFSR